MSSIDFSKNNYEAKRILLNNILLENKDSIVLEQQNSTSVYSYVRKYKFILKINNYRIVGCLEYKDDEVRYLLVRIYQTSWLGLLSNYLGYCIFDWEALCIKHPEDIEQSASYLRCVLKNKVSATIREEERKAEKDRKKELEEGHKLTKTFVNYFNGNCPTSD